METSPSQGVLVLRSGDNWSHKFSKPGKSPAAMAAGSIPAVRCRESDSGWVAEAIQMARHCDTANRISATEENARMKSGIIFLSGVYIAASKGIGQWSGGTGLAGLLGTCPYL